MRALVRLKDPLNFPLNIIVDVGVRSFKVLLEDDGTPILRSKVVQRSNPFAAQMNTSPNQLDLSKVIPQPTASVQPCSNPPLCNTYQIQSSAKGKQVLSSQPSVDILGETIELGFGLGHSTVSEDAGCLSKQHTPPETTDVVGEMLPAKLNRFTGDRPFEAPRIPPVSLERKRKGTLFPYRAEVMHGCSMTIELPCDGNSDSSLAAIHTSHLP